MFNLRPKLIPTLITVPALILLFSLSFWQFSRLVWKNNLIKEIDYQIQQPVIYLPDEIDAKTYSYRKVKVEGKFLHDHEMYLYGGSIEFKGKNGYYVITPLQTRNNKIILVNRGWVPEELKDPTKRLETLTPQLTEVRGSIMIDGEKGLYVHDNQPDKNLWFYINLEEMQSYLKLPIEKFYILAEYEKNTLPIGRNVTPNIRNSHLGYALTWLFAAISLIVIYIIYHRQNS